jgi:NADH dehydrogenase (ubiquinone) 1 alpha subcomplex subunit 9
MDVAQALNALHSMGPLAQTLNLPGPTTHTYAYLLDLVSTLTYNPPSRAPVVPKALALLATKYADKALWWPMLTPDEVERRFIDDVGAAVLIPFASNFSVRTRSVREPESLLRS